jgi:uncharacterized membrane protein
VLSRVRTKLSDFAASTDLAATRMGHLAQNTLFWPLLYAAAIGAGTFVIRHMTWIAVMDTNKVPLLDSIKMIVWVGATLALLGAFYVAAIRVARRLATRRGHLPPAGDAVVAELHRRMRPLLALPILPALTLNAIERDSPKETLFLVALAGVITGASVYAWLRPTARRSFRGRAVQGAAIAIAAAPWVKLLPMLESLTNTTAERVQAWASAVEGVAPDQQALRAALLRRALVAFAGLAGIATIAGAIAGAIAGPSVEVWLRPAPPPVATEGDAPPPRSARREAAAAAMAAAAVVALWAGYGAFFSELSIINHHALRTATIDLGYYDNIFYQSAHGRPLGCSFIKMGYHGSAHFDPILVVLSPLYLLYPRAEFLLVLQSVWLGAGVVPVYLLARSKLRSRASGVALAAMYAVYPALHGANMYEFHSLTLIAPVAIWMLYFLETGRRRAYWALLLPTLLVREDVAILMCFVGGYAILSRRPGWARLGWVTILVSTLYFGIVKRFFMTSTDIFMSGKDSYSFAYYYEDLIPNHNSVAGLLISLFSNPVFVLKTMLGELKILYVLVLFLPLCFLPFFARPGRFVLAWGMLFCLLASRSAVYSPHFQYSCIIIPAAFAMTPEALRQVEDGPFVRTHGLDGARYRSALLAAGFVMSLLASWKFGGIVDNGSFHGGFGPPARALTDKDKETYAWIRSEVDRIPLQDSVGLTNRTGAHAANRRAAFFYPEHSDVDWVFVDDTELRGGDLDRHNKAVQSGVFELVSKHDRFSIYKRKKP